MRTKLIGICVIAGLGLGCGKGESATKTNEPLMSTAEGSKAPAVPTRGKTPDGYDVVFAGNHRQGPQASTQGEAQRASDAAHLVRHPTSPDPLNGQFSLEQAVQGLPVDGSLVAEIRTDLGTLMCDLYADRTPNTVANFIGLARGKRPWWDARAGAWVTKPIYDETTFHRVIPGFMIQGGDYLGDGSGDPGYVIADELVPTLHHDKAGQLCMANRGPNTNGAQFFITDAAAPHLDAMNSYTIFGQCEPAEMVNHIARVPQAGSPTNRPLTPVHIHRVVIRRVSGGAAHARPLTPVLPEGQKVEPRGASPGPTELYPPLPEHRRAR